MKKLQVIHPVVFHLHNILDNVLIKLLLNSKHDRLIVKIQAACILILLYPFRKIFYLNLIKELLRRSNDYRAHIRLYNFIMEDHVNVPIVYIDDFINITNQKYFSTSESIIDTLNELDNYIN